MRNLLMTLSVCLVLAACYHLSGEGGPTTIYEYDKGNGNGDGNGY